MKKDKSEKLDDILNNLKQKDSKESAQEYLLGQLNPKQSEMLKKLISDDEAVKNFMASEQAQKLLKQIMKDKE